MFLNKVKRKAQETVIALKKYGSAKEISKALAQPLADHLNSCPKCAARFERAGKKLDFTIFRHMAETNKKKGVVEK